MSTQEGGKKFDFGKLRYDLLPSRSLSDTVAVLTFGAKKYGDRNWEQGMNWSRPYAAIHRHLSAWWMGEDLDPETQLSHLAHAACEIMFLQEYEKTKLGKSFDDRPGAKPKRIRNKPVANLQARQVELVPNNQKFFSCLSCKRTYHAENPNCALCVMLGESPSNWEPA